MSSQSRTRTCNLAINSRLLCQLSYLGLRYSKVTLSPALWPHCWSNQACNRVDSGLSITALRQRSMRLDIAWREMP